MAEKGWGMEGAQRVRGWGRGQLGPRPLLHVGRMRSGRHNRGAAGAGQQGQIREIKLIQ